MSNDVVMVAIPKELRDRLINGWGAIQYYDDLELLRTAPETVSLEGVERFHPHTSNERGFEGMYTQNDGDYGLFSDMKCLVAPVQPSEFHYETFINGVEAFGWCDSDILRDIKSAMGTAKWVNEPVQPSAVVSREILEDEIQRATQAWANQDPYPIDFGIFAKTFNEHLSYWLQNRLQLPQPIAPVQGTILEPIHPATTTASTDQAPAQSGGVETYVVKSGKLYRTTRGSWQTVLEAKNPDGSDSVFTYLTTTQSAPSVPIEWIPVDMAKLPDGLECDLWVPNEGRLPNYRLQKNYAGKKGNHFFTPIHSGLACIREATHYRLFPDDPK